MKYDGFISTRGDSREFGFQLANELLGVRYKVRAAEQAQCEDSNKPDHMQAAEELIYAGCFAVILLGPSRLTPPDDHDCYQLKEIEVIKQREARAIRDQQDFRVFVILLQDEAGAPSKEEFDEALEEDARGSKDVRAWLKNHKNTHFIPDFENSSSAAFEQALSSLAAKISKYVTGIRDRARAIEKLRIQDAKDKERGKKPPELPIPGGANASGIEELEQRYLSKAILQWTIGEITKPERRKSKKNGRANAFNFAPARFVEFQATQHRGDGSFDHTASTHPLSHWLFAPQEKPLVLLGYAGAGKTTALAAAACAFASVWNAKFAEHCRSIAGGEWLDAAQQKLVEHKCPRYVPVVLRCPDLAGEMSDAASNAGVLTNAVLTQLRALGLGSDASPPDNAAINEFTHRLRKQPYVLLLDGLDEVADVEQAQALFKAAHDLAVDCREAESRVIFTSRPDHQLELDAHEIYLEPPLHSWDHIELFIRRFAAARAGRNAPNVSARLLKNARAIWDLGDGRNAPLKTPLLLNAFCCVAQDDETHGAYERDFCGQLIDYFLEERSFPELQAHLLDQSAVAVGEAPRNMLRWLALTCLRASQNAFVGRAAAAKALCGKQALAELGLGKLTMAKAQAILDELSRHTNLFVEDDRDQYSFVKQALFCEYLAGEAMAASDPGAFIDELPNHESATWRNAISFAAAIRLETLGDDDEAGLEPPRKLLERAESLDDADRAFEAARTALEILGKHPIVAEADGLGGPILDLVARAANVYKARRGQWPASRRATLLEHLTRVSRRSSGVATCVALEEILSRSLAPRRRWMAADAEALPKHFQVADCPVLVAEYRRFVEAPDARNDSFWGHTRSAPDSAEARTLINDESGASPAAMKRRDSWVAQMEQPGSPVVHVSWYEAVAYCQWETRRLRAVGEIAQNEEVRLPTEDEWTALMKWASGGAEFPWGATPPKQDPQRVNWRRADVDRPSPPGVFEATGVDGLYDLGSNVACWSVPAWDAGQPWPPTLSDFAAIGGASWIESAEPALRAVARVQGRPAEKRADYIGFRLVRALVSGGHNV